MDLHDGHGEELERVVDRPRIVRPRTGIRDHAVRPLVRLVAPVDELALVVRLPAARRALELDGPLVDPRLELGEPETPVELGITDRQRVEVDAVQHRDPHDLTLCDEGVESRSDALGLDLRRHEGLAGTLEEDEAHAPADRLLVALERGPGAVAVDRDGLGREDLLDRAGLVVETGQREAPR